MSVELYLYPQDYGFEQQIAVDFLGDQNFQTLNASSSQIQAGVQAGLNAIVPTSLPFQWNRFANAAINYPQQSNPLGYLTLRNQGGLIQRITGLTVGTTYSIAFEYVANSAQIQIILADNLTIILQQTFSGNTAGQTASYSFTATVPSLNFVIFGLGNSTTKNWTCTNKLVAPLSGGQVIVDLFDEKQIPLTLSVDNFTNAAEKTQSYSKSFKLPGTDRNNKILRNVYEITASIDFTSYDFNPYIKTPIVLQEDGSTIFTGFMKLLNVDFKGQDMIYNVNLYSETVSIKDILKDRKFYDLDFSELQHLYQKDVIKSSWDNSPGLLLSNPLPPDSFAGAAGSLNTTVLKYPFVDWSHGATVAVNPGAPPLSGPADGQPEFSSLGQMFRPFISVRYCIDRIFEAAEYTWSSSFFNTADFNNLFMDFNWGANNMPLIGGDWGLSNWYKRNTDPYVYALNNAWTNIPLRSGFSFFGFSFIIPGYNQTLNRYQETTNYVKIDWNNTALKWENVSATTVNITVEIIKNGGLTLADTYSQTFNATANSSGTFSMSTIYDMLMVGDIVEQRWITTSPLADPTAVRIQQGSAGNPSVKTNMTTVSYNIVGADLLQTERGKLNQWSFLKGILDMFNLLTVADPTNNRNIIIEPYDTIFPRIGTGGGSLDLNSRGITKDWTDKVDVEKLNLKPLTTLKKLTDFQYAEDSSDYTFKNYKDAFGGFLYGSLTFDASGLNLLVGKSKITASPFAATLNKPFGATTPQLWSPAIYKLKDDGTGEEFANKPRILYDNGRNTMTDGTFYIPGQNGQSSENANTYLQFSGFSSLPITATTNDLNFGTCQLIGEDNNTVLNLYNRFYSSYYSDLYNPNIRIVKIQIKLNSADINQFSFSDIVMIKNRAFRVNKINYNPGQLAKVELILIP